MMMTKNCLHCDLIFTKKMNESLKNWNIRHKYCSRACSNEAKKIQKVCGFCSAIFIGTNKQFCSKTCRSKVFGFPKGHKPNPVTYENLKNGKRFTKGQTPWNKGIVWDAMRGEKHPNWKGGKPKSKNGHMLSYEDYRKYKDWQKAVFRRDKWDCQFCGKHGGELHADHIKPWAIYHELRFDVDNGRTLCPSCHRKTETYGKKASSYKGKVAA